MRGPEAHALHGENAGDSADQAQAAGIVAERLHHLYQALENEVVQRSPGKSHAPRKGGGALGWDAKLAHLDAYCSGKAAVELEIADSFWAGACVLEGGLARGLRALATLQRTAFLEHDRQPRSAAPARQCFRGTATKSEDRSRWMKSSTFPPASCRRFSASAPPETACWSTSRMTSPRRSPACCPGPPG